MEIHGIIKEIGAKEQKTDTFSLVKVTLDTSTYQQGSGERYENYAQLQFLNDNIQKLDGFTTGQRVKITFGIYGKEVQTNAGKKFFSQNLNAYKIEKL